MNSLVKASLKTPPAMSAKLRRLLHLLHLRSDEIPSTHRHVAALVRNGKIVAMATNRAHAHAEEVVLRLLPG
jgi:hypothetical protein